MLGSVKFALGVVLSIFLLLSCSLLLLNAEAEASLEKLNLEDTLIRIQTSSGNPVLDVQLLENTDNCFVNCYAILRIHPYQDITLPGKANSEFDWNFVKEKPCMEGLVSHHFELLETTEYSVEVPEYDKNLANSTCYNVDNTTYDCEVEKTVQTGSHLETRYKDEYKPFDFWGETLEAGKDYTIKLVGKKKPQVGENNVDWIPTIKGFKLKEWEWWNTSYNKCIKVTNSTLADFPAGYENEFAFSNSDVAYADFMADFADLRITNGTDCNSDSGTEMYYWRHPSCNKTNTSANCTIYINMTSANQTTFLMYYNASGVSDGSNGWLTFRVFDDFNRADGSPGGNWTERMRAVGACSYHYSISGNKLYITYYGVGSNCLLYWNKQNITYPLITEFESNITGGGTDQWHKTAYGMIYNRSNEYIHISGYGVRDDRAIVGRYDGSWNTTYATWDTSLNEKYNMKFEFVDDGSNVDIDVSGDSYPAIAETSRYSSIRGETVGDGYSGIYTDTVTLYLDDFRTRLYISNPPSWTVGDEVIKCPSDDTYINQNTEFLYNFCNVSDSGSMGILIINASNIVLDCNGMTLNGTGSGTGIYNKGFHNFTIKECIVQNYESDIKFDNDLIAEVKESVSHYE